MKTQVLPRIAARIVSLLLILAACGATPAQQPTTATGEFLSAPSDADPLEICRQHLQRNKAAKGLSADDLAELVVRDRYQTRRTRTTHLYLRQQIDGIDVEGADFVAAIDSRGRLLTEGDRLVRGLRPRISTRTAELERAAGDTARGTAVGPGGICAIAANHSAKWAGARNGIQV